MTARPHLTASASSRHSHASVLLVYDPDARIEDLEADVKEAARNAIRAAREHLRGKTA